MKQQLVRWGMSPLPRWIGRRLAGSFLPIFMLHRCTDDSGRPDPRQIQAFRDCLSYFRHHGYRAITLQQLLESMDAGEPLPERTAVFTVDDGFHDQAEILAPLFAEFDIPLTYFVITDFLEGKLWSWDDQLLYVLRHTKLESIPVTLPNEQEFVINLSLPNPHSSVREALKSSDQGHIYEWLDHLYEAADVDRPSFIPDRYRPMSWQQAQALIDQGHAIAPHTRSHRILSQLSDEEARQEILGSWEDLQRKVPGCSPVFAYPTGRNTDFTPRDRKIVEDSPLLGAVSTEPNSVQTGNDRYALPRFGMPTDIVDFMQYLDYIEVLKGRLRSLPN